MANEFSKECVETLELLASSKNVLISGPPGTGKSKLLGEVAQAFAQGLGPAKPSAGPVHDPKAKFPIPPRPSQTESSLTKALPSPDRRDRKIFRTAFHQNSKHREFVSGIVPIVSIGEEKPGTGFRVIKGTLYKASEHAKSADGASLLVIDEINRGPAVQIFGGAIVAIEADKRLGPDGSESAKTQWFEILSPSDGEIIEYALPHHLYILAAMNQADASVEPLDVAFLRRWEPYKLLPDSDVLRKHFGIPSGGASIPEKPSSAQDVFEASVRAWGQVNRRISLGRGPEFQIGHGVLMGQDAAAMDLDMALAITSKGWAKARAHVEEVFFGDVRGVAAVFNAINAPSYHPLKLVETTFADDLRFEIAGPETFSPSNIYDALRAIAGE